MHTVLDLDLDFFVWPIAHDREEGAGRLDYRDHQSQSKEQICQFLEHQCGLSREVRIPGRRVVQHVDAFTTWREWLLKKILAEPFDVIHADAHSDLGSGPWNPSPKFFEAELLKIPLLQRAHPRMGRDAVNSGNYLVAAVANRWIATLTYVYPVNPNPRDLCTSEGLNALQEIQEFLSDGFNDEILPVRDLPGYCFRDQKPNTKVIELKEFSSKDWDRSVPVHIEPSVPFDWVSSEEFKYSRFTHMVVAQSPAYTPETADSLLEVICEYFKET